MRHKKRSANQGQKSWPLAEVLRGDTALVIKAATSDEFYDLEIREILCKPRKTKN